MSPPPKKRKMAGVSESGDHGTDSSSDIDSSSDSSDDHTPMQLVCQGGDEGGDDEHSIVKVLFGDHELLTVKLTEEEKKLSNEYGFIFDFASESADSDESMKELLPPEQRPQDDDASSRSRGSSLGQCCSTSSASDSSLNLPLPSKGALSRFLRSTATNEWNERDNAAVFFELFGVTACIVHPNHFLSKYRTMDFKQHEIGNNLTMLEKKKSCLGVAWSSLVKPVEEFLGIYTDDLEELADVYGDRRMACQFITRFRNSIKEVQQEAKYTFPG